ncbi:MAG: PmoA family protein [Verrucomicrobiota bacterium]
MKLGFFILLVSGFSLSTVAAAELVCEESDDEIVITRDGRHVLTYNKTVRVPADVGEEYGRSGFIHPISTPSGRVLTDGYPVPHHAHQHGLFFAWKAGTFEGEKVNFWEPGKDVVRHVKVLEIINEGDAAGFRVELAHDSGDKKVLTETWTVTVEGETGHIDLVSEQRCASESPLTLDQIHYGAMALRGSRQWFPDAHTSMDKGATKDEFVEVCTMITSEGLTQEDGNHSRPEWVSMTGAIDGAPVAITLIPHPSNFRYPQHVRLHPKMPYFCFIPTVEEPFTIEPGETWVSRYRIVVGDGELDGEEIELVREGYVLGDSGVGE